MANEATISGDPNLLNVLSPVIQNGMGKMDPNELAARIAALVLSYAVREGASDIHFDPQESTITLRFRIDGQLKDVLIYPKREFPITARIRVMADFPAQAATTYTPEDGRFQVNVGGHMVQFRVSAFPTIYGDKLVLRLLDMGQNTLNVNALGFSPQAFAQVKAFGYAPSGMVVISGLTGCGKTTTLCSILNMRRNEEINIMTLEDPVEYVLPRVTHAQVNVKTGFTFAEGLRSILRQDPNIVMVGEMRDNETAEIAMRAALTGHLIFSTVHAATTTGAIQRLLGMGIEPYVVSSSLIGVISQRLVRRLCPQCAQPTMPNPAIIQSMIKRSDPEYLRRIMDIVNRPGARFLKPKGCPACKNTGYHGRIGVFEILVINDTMRQFILNTGKADIGEMRRTAISTGMTSLLMDAVEKCRAGLTSQEEIARVVDESF